MTSDRRPRGRCLVLLIMAVALLMPTAAHARDRPVPYSFLSPQYVGAALTPNQAPPGANDWSCRPSAAHPSPVVLVHALGVNQSLNWQTLSPRLTNAGYCVYTFNYGGTVLGPLVGGLGPIDESAATLSAFVDRVLAATGTARVDLVGHSEGTVVSAWYLKYGGGAAKVGRSVNLTPVYEGTTLLGLSHLIEPLARLLPRVAGLVDLVFAAGQQLLPNSSFVAKLNAGGTAAVPGVRYTSIMTRFDEVVTPVTSGVLDVPNATNLYVQDACSKDYSEHVSMASDPIATRLVLNALDPAHAQAPKCRFVPPFLGSPGPDA